MIGYFSFFSLILKVVLSFKALDRTGNVVSDNGNRHKINENSEQMRYLAALMRNTQSILQKLDTQSEVMEAFWKKMSVKPSKEAQHSEIIVSNSENPSDAPSLCENGRNDCGNEENPSKYPDGDLRLKKQLESAEINEKLSRLVNQTNILETSRHNLNSDMQIAMGKIYELETNIAYLSNEDNQIQQLNFQEILNIKTQLGNISINHDGINKDIYDLQNKLSDLSDSIKELKHKKIVDFSSVPTSQNSEINVDNLTIVNSQIRDLAAVQIYLDKKLQNLTNIHLNVLQTQKENEDALEKLQKSVKTSFSDVILSIGDISMTQLDILQTQKLHRFYFGMLLKNYVYLLLKIFSSLIPTVRSPVFENE